MNRSGNWFWLIGILVVVRLVIPIRSGAISGDDIIFLSNCWQWWAHGHTTDLTETWGSSGIVYSGFHHVLWAVAAGMMSFRLAPIFALHALLMIAPALLLGMQMRGQPGARWMVLLALSSPLFAYFSLSLLPLWWIAPLGGLVGLQLAVAEDAGRPPKHSTFLLVGLVSGYLAGVYPSLSALTLGLFVWLLVRRTQKSICAIFLLGCAIGYLPFIWLLVSHWSELRLRLAMDPAPTSWLQLAGGIFRYWGVAPAGRLNSQGLSAAIESKLLLATPWIWLGIVLLMFFAVAHELRAKRRLPAYVQLGLCAWGAYLLFAFATHTETWHHQAGNLWWISPVLLVWGVQVLVSRRSAYVLGGFVGFNLMSFVLLYSIRLLWGTTAEPVAQGHSHGPAWWMQEALVKEIAARADEELALGVKAPLAIQCEPVFQFELRKLFRIQHPELDRKVKWVAESLPRADLVVARDRDRPYRLHLSEWPNDWHRPEFAQRNVVQISSPRAWDNPVQLSISLPVANGEHLELIDANGQLVPYWTDRPEEGGLTWFRLPSLSQGVNAVWAYRGSAGSVKRTSWAPTEVFDFFEAFDASSNDWTPQGDARWEVTSGICRLTLTNGTHEIKSARYVHCGTVSSGTLEARIRFVGPSRPVNAGLVFAARPDSPGYIWAATGYGSSRLSQIRTNDVIQTLAESPWYWKGQPGRWFVLGAQWHGPEIKVLAEGRVVYETINLDETGIGQIGIGALPNPGEGVQPLGGVEFDWLRVRTNFLDATPVVQVRATERQR